MGPARTRETGDLVCAALWNIGVMAGSGPAALPIVAGLWWWQWENWNQAAIDDCQRGIFQ